MSDSGVAAHSNLTAELLEFWVSKYREAKHESETLQARIVKNEEFLQDVVTSSRNEMKFMQQQLEAYQIQNGHLHSDIGRLNAERATLHTQLQLSYSQAVSLASEADKQRKAAIVSLFKAQPMVDYLSNETPPDISFLSPKELAGTLCRVCHFVAAPVKVCIDCNHRLTLPLHIGGPCQPGYWFCPLNLHSMDSPFELVVETESNKWTYHGQYITRLFTGYEMRLSEWMTRSSKSIFSSRVANQRSGGLQASVPLQVHTRQWYDSGLWKIPSYTLQCVGYDNELCIALAAAAARLERGREISTRPSEVASISTPSTRPGKRRRTKTLPTCEDQSTRVNTTGCAEAEKETPPNAVEKNDQNTDSH
ncbi:Dolichyl-diphosphooligosaccharide--protein glycosyltransferase subunit WBP1 [Favolaschia claudopus]|uniref:Dolichyl-diphosphooligosaccharide--protein glycosyltransferase subunit WBP1 n=1 Tax=Favolaschia claudopus TaxID=2862362 RepID=A0AAW0C7Q3_9AGAR